MLLLFSLPPLFIMLLLFKMLLLFMLLLQSAMLLTLLELSMWPRGRLILIMLDMLDWDTPDMEAMEDMVLAMEVTLDILDMEDMAMDMVLLATLSITGAAPAAVPGVVGARTYAGAGRYVANSAGT